MRRHTRGGDAGFSFVELLVTIVIAGIAFAAMVPMFLAAQQTNTSDTVRLAALRIAEDRLEKVRQLDYDQITLANLQSSTFYNGQFGESQVANVGSTAKTFQVSYTVDLYPSTATLGQERFKTVQVDVYWTGNPQPVEHVILRTNTYRQYAGPLTVNLRVQPRDEDEDGWVTSSTVVMTAYVASFDISTCQYVHLAVYADNGAEVASKDVYRPGSWITGKPNAVISSSATAGEFRWTWNAASAPDAVYTFAASAFSGAYGGNTYTTVARLERGAPDPPLGLTATPGNGLVELAWTLSPSSDVEHYELWRGTASGAEALYVDDMEPTTASYSDTNVINDTTYYYVMYAIDLLGQRSSPSLEVSATPETPALDSTPPTTPTLTTAVEVPSQSAISLAWTASSDEPPPATPSGLDRYLVYRCATNSADAADWALVHTALSTVTSWDDNTAGFDTTWWYRVVAVDVKNNASPASNALSARTDPMPTYTLTVKNGRTANNKYIYVWVKDAYAVPVVWYNQSGTDSTTKPAYVRINSKGATAAWTNMPPGTYTVIAAYDSSTATNPRSQNIVLGPSGTVTFPN